MSDERCVKCDTGHYHPEDGSDWVLCDDCTFDGFLLYRRMSRRWRALARRLFREREMRRVDLAIYADACTARSKWLRSAEEEIARLRAKLRELGVEP